MKAIAVVTTTRAEFGQLAPVIKLLRKQENRDFVVEVIVSGTHLSEQYGKTIQEIEEQNIRIDIKIEIPIETTFAIDISRNQSDCLVKFTSIFQKKNYAGVLLLGDRYEMLAVAIAAGNTRTPIFHMGGGDTTEGALDEWIRHSITKISYLHFVTNSDSFRRVIQLGEDPSRVFNYGSTSVDNIISIADMSKEEALSSINMSNCKYAICTYHPVTQDDVNMDEPVNDFLKAISKFSDIQFIITKSNADQGGLRINNILEEAEKKLDNVHVYSSLGTRRYLSLMKHSEFVLGNSSSGIIEAPSFKVPTINIGDRQKGRLQTRSIINCGESCSDIEDAIKTAISEEHRAVCNQVISPYGDGHAAERIASKIMEVINGGRIDLKKTFYDLKIYEKFSDYSS